MINNDVRRNGSGYYDDTAYKAIMNVNREEKNGMNILIQKGDIYEIEKANGTYTYAIILQTFEEMSIILTLSDKRREEYVEVICQGIKYTDPRMVQYCFNDRILGFHKKMKDEEYSAIMEKVYESLGFECDTNGNTEEVAGLKEDLETAKNTIEEKEALLEAKEKLVDTKNKTIERMFKERDELLERINNNSDSQIEKERDFYKDMYEHLKDKIIGA